MKKIVRKPTLHEQRCIKLVEQSRGLEVYRDEWPLWQEMVDDGLVVMSGPRGPGQAWKRVALPKDADW